MKLDVLKVTVLLAGFSSRTDLGGSRSMSTLVVHAAGQTNEELALSSIFACTSVFTIMVIKVDQLTIISDITHFFLSFVFYKEESDPTVNVILEPPIIAQYG